MVIGNFLLYVSGHCLADTSLQTDAMARGKSRHTPIDPARVPVGQKPLKLWYHWLTHHAMIQGLIAFLVTYLITRNMAVSYMIGGLELVLHWCIDFCKCDNYTTPNQDQALHMATKVLYCFLIGG
jgi:hypothetical protein